MRSKLLLSTALAGLSAIGLALSHLPAAAADDVKAVAIIKNENGKFVFTDTSVKIEEGQTVKWVAVDSGVTHQLVADSEDDALTDTGTFDSTTPATQKFATAGTIKYHCAIHPKSMRGTITVAAAKAPDAAAEAPAEEPAKQEAVERADPKPKQGKRSYGSYGYSY